MRNRGAFYLGVMLLLLGLLFLAFNLGATLFPMWEVMSIGRLWPLFVIWIGLGFFLPIFVWWEKRHSNYGLAMPGTIVLVIGLILLYCSLTGNWAAWAFLWALVPFSVGLGLLMLYLLGPKARGLLVAAFFVGGGSLAIFAVFASWIGGPLGGIVGAALLLILGVALVIRALIRPPAASA
jgi:hypothetical protein